MKKNESVTVEIEENVSLTKSIAHIEGKKVIINGGWRSQKAVVRIRKIRSSRIEADFVEAVEKAPFETDGICCDFGKCGGCNAGGITYEKQLEFKSDYVKKLFDKASIEYEEFEKILPSPSVYEYRNKMEFSFGNEVKDGDLTLGMHEKGKHHSIVSVKNCKISPCDFNKINEACENFFRQRKTSFYNKNTKEGFLRHLVLRHSVYENAIMINLVTTTSEKLDSDAFVNMLLSLKLNSKLSGILHTYNDSFADAVIAKKTELLYGNDFITESLCGLKFKITPFSFFQTNTLGAQQLYEKVREYCGDTSDKNIFDLYCGTGTIAQIVSKGAKKVYGIELVEEAAAAAAENAQLNGITNCEFMSGDVLKMVDELNDKADIIILDPPRAGINPKAEQKIIAFNPQTFIYVSCKAQSLVNDLPAFIEAGYKVKKVCPVDMFAHTEHVETVCLLSRE